jgi:hypothetical protein
MRLTGMGCHEVRVYNHGEGMYVMRGRVDAGTSGV